MVYQRGDDLPRGAAHDAVHVVRVDLCPDRLDRLDRPSTSGVVGVSALSSDVLLPADTDLLRRGSFLPRAGRGSASVARVFSTEDDDDERSVETSS